MSLGLNSLYSMKAASGTSFVSGPSIAVKPFMYWRASSGLVRTSSTPLGVRRHVFFVASGFFLMNSVVRLAEPPNHGAIGSPRMYCDHAGLDHARRAVHAAGGAGGLERVDGVDLAGRDRGDVLADRQLDHVRAWRRRARAWSWPASRSGCRDPSAIFLPLSSAIVLTGLSLATMNSSSTNFALLGLVQKILNSPGCAISPIARLAEPVPLALPWSGPRASPPSPAARPRT